MLIPIKDSNSEIYYHLYQAYEAEFSAVSGKYPDATGKFSLDTDYKPPYEAFYWSDGRVPLGFVNKGVYRHGSDIAEFYVVPSARKKLIGQKMAFEIFDKYPGIWRVRVLIGADQARSFWKKVIHEYVQDNYDEFHEDDPDYGKVTTFIFSKA